jgi:hypothetical protein
VPEKSRQEGWTTVRHDHARPHAAASAHNRATGGAANRIRRALPALVLCSGLVLGVIPAVPAAAQGGPSSCAAAAVGQVSCAALAAPRATAMTKAAASATAPPGYSPAQLQSAYGLESPSQTGGAGQTVAVVTAYDDPTAETDMGTYRSEYNLPACTTADGCFSKVNETGGSSYPPTGPAGWTLADAGALDMISAICPNCHILLVEAGITTDGSTTVGITDLGAAENEAVSLGADFVDNTWFTPEATYGTSEPAYDADYFNHPGVAITAPDGNGAGYGTYYPAASPDVIAVGGTTLTQDTGTARGWTETAWSGSGSGCSPYEAKPSWQTDTGCSTRTLNDTAAVADPNTPVALYDTSSGGWVATGGNGVAAAIVASAYALAGTPASDIYPAAYLYANAGGLYSITSGLDGTCAPSYLCTAVPGYNGPTGLGTPDGVSAFLSSYYQPITPTRFLDTRYGTGGTTGPVKAGATVKLRIAGVNGIPSANVTAVAITVTAVDESSSGDLVLYPDGATLPGTSNLNFVANTAVANLAIVPVGADGEIDILNQSGGTTQVLGDVSGYFTSDMSAAGDTTYTPITPVPVLDTRVGLGAPKAKLAAGATLALQVGGANGIPTGISAVAINITAVDDTGNGFLVDYADGTTLPATSNLQFHTQTIAEMAIVPVGADGKIDIYDAVTGTDVVGAVLGYFTAGTTGEAYRAIASTRLIRRAAVPAGGTLGVAQGSTVVAPSPTLLLNVTALEGSAGGFLIAYPAGTSVPSASIMDYAAGEIIANLDLGATGGGTAELYNGLASVVLDIDCSGYLSSG